MTWTRKQLDLWKSIKENCLHNVRKHLNSGRWTLWTRGPCVQVCLCLNAQVYVPISGIVSRLVVSRYLPVFTYRCACRSCSRSVCSGRSSTRRTCTHSVGHVSPGGCCSLGRSTAGRSCRGRWTFGCSGVLWCRPRPTAGPPGSS